MTNRFKKWSKSKTLIVCLAALGGGLSSCTDDYTLDEEKPSFLNSSIYETLEESGNHKMFLQLINDKELNTSANSDGEKTELAEILSKTGSRTVFAADDDAWAKFFADNAQLPETNPWHYATSYDKLSKAQKLLLLNTSMLPNAIVMENLASSTGSNPTRGETLRHYTKTAPTDSITSVKVADLFHSYWNIDKQIHPEVDENGNVQPEVDQWARIKNGTLTKESILMAQDASASMLIHFTNEYMAKNQIDDKLDFHVLMNGADRITSDVHIYDSKLDSTDLVCLNGYLNYTSTPLVPKANMAEVIRTNGKTKIFSHILERFSVPFHSVDLARQYRLLHPDFPVDDTIYVKRYYSDRSYGSISNVNVEVAEDWRGNLFAGGKGKLKFDPGWNEYFPEGSDPTKDMGAIFVSNDASMLEYFRQGGGRVLIEEYTLNPHSPNEYALEGQGFEYLLEDIDQIPLSRFREIINNVMFTSFVSSVPSKMLKLIDPTSQQQIFTENDTKLVAEGGNIEKVELACNGPVYIMNNVYTPTDFDCVATPAYLKGESTNKIMNWAIYSDSENKQNPQMGLNYFAYLKAMRSCFTFFLPTDEALKYYYDPVSFVANVTGTQMANKNVTAGRVVRFLYIDGSKSEFPFKNGSGQNYITVDGKKIYSIADYDIVNGKILKVGNVEGQTRQYLDKAEQLNRLRQMLEDNTIVHQEVGTDYIDDGTRLIPKINDAETDEYYLTKSGMGVKVTRENGQVVYAQGGFQLENEREIDKAKHAECATGVIKANVEVFGSYKNGFTFTMDAPLIPASRSAWSVLANVPRGFKKDKQDEAEGAAENNPYQKFYEYCDHPDIPLDELIKKSGLVDETQYDINIPSQLKQLQAAIEKYETFVSNRNGMDYNVSFWQNYNYTVFAPTNEAIDEAIAAGLPTWQEVYEKYEGYDKDEEGNIAKREDSLELQKNIVLLTNFVRMHFVDNSIFVDKSDVNKEMVTNSFDNEHQVFNKVYAKRVGGTLSVSTKQEGTDWADVVEKYNGRDVKNIMTCDRSCNKAVKNATTMNGLQVEYSNYAVVHLIDKALMPELPTSEDPQSLSRYVERFKIR